MKKILNWLFLFALVSAATWLYFTPQLAFREIRIAVRDRNLGLLESRVNFPAVRAGLKVTIQARLSERMSGSGVPFGRFGAALAGSVVEPLIDQLVTPETLALLMRGFRTSPGSPPPNTVPAETPPRGADGSAGPETREPDDKETTRGYESFNRYVITVKRKGAPGAPIAFVLTRESLLDWKLVEIRNPF